MELKQLVEKFKVDSHIKFTDGSKALIDKVQNWGNMVNIQYYTDTGKKRDINVEANQPIDFKIARKSKKLQTQFDKFVKQDRLRNLNKVTRKSGSDPEIFVIDKVTNEVVPAFNFLGSSKEPTLIKRGVNNHGEGNPLFWDGFQAEFNTDAENCLSWVIDSTYAGLKTLSNEAKKHNKNAVLAIQPTIDIPIDMLMESKKEHVEFGCNPSFNAYGHEGLKMDGRDVPFRSSGGHLHFELSDKRKATVEKYVKALDKIIGVACVSLFEKYDDPRRRQLYGLAGEYRRPDHGMEYRTLSSVWMCHPLIMNMVFDLSRMVISAAESDMITMWDATEEETIDCINNCDVKLARKILKRNKNMFINLNFSHCRDDSKSNTIYNIFMSGLDSILDNPSDVEGNWFTGYLAHCEGTFHKIGNMTNHAKYEEIAALTL